MILAEAPDDYGPLTTLGVEDYVCDMVVVLRNVVDGERRGARSRSTSTAAARTTRASTPAPSRPAA